MRVRGLMLVLSLVAAIARADEDAPAPTQAPIILTAPQPSLRELLADEDDPKIARGDTLAPVAATAPRPEHYSPAIKIAYRYLTARGLDNPTGARLSDHDITLHTVELDMYPVSTPWFRVGLDAELSFGSAPRYGDSQFLEMGFDVGFQYPWRVTPFVDARLIGGLVFGDVAGRNVLSYGYTYGIDVGIELYIVERLYMSIAIGWVHPVYKGVDLQDAMAHPNQEPNYLDISSDSFTLKVGIGL